MMQQQPQSNWGGYNNMGYPQYGYGGGYGYQPQPQMPPNGERCCSCSYPQFSTYVLAGYYPPQRNYPYGTQQSSPQQKEQIQPDQPGQSEVSPELLENVEAENILPKMELIFCMNYDLRWNHLFFSLRRPKLSRRRVIHHPVTKRVRALLPRMINSRSWKLSTR